MKKNELLQKIEEKDKEIDVLIDEKEKLIKNFVKDKNNSVSDRFNIWITSSKKEHLGYIPSEKNILY